MSPPVKAELAGSITTLKDRLQTFYRHRDNTCEQDESAVSGTIRTTASPYRHKKRQSLSARKKRFEAM
jgi:hypothetical protein